MQYHEFEHNYLFDIIPNRMSYIRNGQSLMIYLAEASPVLYDKITATEADCFYVDKKIPLALNWLEENWSLNFEPIEEFLTKWCVEQHNKFPNLAFKIESDEYNYWYIEITNTNEKLDEEYILDESLLRDVVKTIVRRY